MPELKFSCTLCGGCCRDHNLPLTIDEAIAWLADGGDVVVLCEASPWSSEPPADDARAAHIRRRSFAASSGGLDIRVTVILAAVVAGPCRNLGADNLCRIYERRPLVCRIYPAEINPFIELQPAAKACPPEAWQSGAPLLAGGRVVDAGTRALIETSRRVDSEDAPRKRRLCRALGIDVASLKGEGFVVYAVARSVLSEALLDVRGTEVEDRRDAASWRLFTPRQGSLASLREQGMEAIAQKAANETYWYAAIASAPTA